MIGTIYLPDDYKEGEKRPGIIANSDGPDSTKYIRPCLPAR